MAAKKPKKTTTKQRATINLVAYDQALSHYWKAEYAQALHIVAQQIEEEHTALDELKLYRLWVEVIACLEDKAALRQLNDHLAFQFERHRATMSPEQLANYAALRGTIHFELDEIEAAHLIMRSVGEYINQPYVAELAQRYWDRLWIENNDPLWAQRQRISDYVLLQSLATSSLQGGSVERLEWIFDCVDSLWSQAPLRLEYYAHALVDAKNWSEAILQIDDLLAKFPNHTNYLFIKGTCLTRQENYAEAINVLTFVSRQTHDRDPDILAWLGMALGRHAQHTHNSHLTEEARVCLEKSISLFKDQGLPFTFPHQELSRLNAQTTPHSTKGKMWLVHLTATEFAQLRGASQHQLRLITRVINRDARPGDRCVFAGSDYQQSGGKPGKVRVAALYTVHSEAYTHPTKGSVYDLALVSRVDSVTLPIDLSPYLGKNAATQRRSQWVFELNADAQRYLAQELEGFSNESEGFLQSLSEFRTSV